MATLFKTFRRSDGWYFGYRQPEQYDEPTEFGPYDTKKQADEDRVGCERSARIKGTGWLEKRKPCQEQN